MARSIPYCERCNYYHDHDEPCFGFLDRDDIEQETALDRKQRLEAERADRERENEIELDSE